MNATARLKEPTRSKPPATRSYRRARSARWNKGLQILASLSLLGLAIWAGIWTIPTPKTLQPTYSATFASDASLSLWSQKHSLAFVFEDQLHPRQCGAVLVESDHKLALSPYTSEKCHAALTAAQRVSLQPAGLPLLWSLLPASDRDELTSEGMDLAEGVAKPFANVMKSPYFREQYGPELSKTIEDALRQAWSSPRVQAAWLDVLTAVDPAYTEKLVNELWPIAVEKTKSGLYDAVSGLGQALLGGSKEPPKSVNNETGSLTARVLQELASDPRSQALLFNTFVEISSDPKVGNFANLFATETLLALMADHRLPKLADRVATDPRLLAEWQGDRMNFDFFTKKLPRKLLRYRHPRDHNPLVAYLVRSILLGHNDYVVLMMTDEQAKAAEAQGISPGFLLKAAQP